MCFCDLSVHYYIPLVTFAAQRVCVMNCEHPVLMSSSGNSHNLTLKSKDQYFLSVLWWTNANSHHMLRLNFFKISFILLNNCVSLKLFLNIFLLLCLSSDDERPRWSLSWQLHQKGKIISPIDTISYLPPLNFSTSPNCTIQYIMISKLFWIWSGCLDKAFCF